MPLDFPTVLGKMRIALVANGIAGDGSNLLSVALARALCEYSVLGMVVTTVDAGVVGTGKGSGMAILLPPPVLAASFGSLPGASILGVGVAPFISGMSIGYAAALAGALIDTKHPAVGTGTGQVKVVPNTLVSIPIFVGAFATSGMIGIGFTILATAIAVGFDGALPFATGTVAIAGPSGSSPAAGAGAGKLL